MSALSGDEVLISSPHCAQTMMYYGNTTLAQTIKLEMSNNRHIRLYRDIAEECYSEDSVNVSPRCNDLVQKQLPWSADTNAPCPFASQICKSQNRNIRLQTGMLDSNDHLGFNAPPTGRVQFQQIMECAPLIIDGYADSFNFSVQGVTVPYRRYFYGPNIDYDRNYSFIERNDPSSIWAAKEGANELASYGLG
jgi:hypothetical protein